MPLRPVLYLDLDDTLISWSGGHPHAAPAAREFVLWAMERFELRWLTTWCPSGEMEEKLLGDLCHMLQLPTEALAHVRGFDWDESRCKLNGVAWLEHLALGRPFVWVEDERGVGEREIRFLADHGLLHHYRWCNVTDFPDSLADLFGDLRTLWDGQADAA